MSRNDIKKLVVETGAPELWKLLRFYQGMGMSEEALVLALQIGLGNAIELAWALEGRALKDASKN